MKCQVSGGSYTSNPSCEVLMLHVELSHPSSTPMRPLFPHFDAMSEGRLYYLPHSLNI